MTCTNFNIDNFPYKYMSSNISANPTYSVWCIHLTAHQNKQNMRYTVHSSFVIRHRLLTERLNRNFGTVNCVNLSRSLSEDVMHYLASKVLNVKTHVHEGICIPLVVKHELYVYLNIFIITTSFLLLLQVEDVVQNLYSTWHCMPAATYTTEFCHFSL